ncbi:MAG TPA: DUF3341 domain-containing protein [Pirellulales bacterium]|jgi:hypothetical protein|nr:DUF3341 domain-containing protein [Pirellulales bacterium]
MSKKRPSRESPEKEAEHREALLHEAPLPGAPAPTSAARESGVHGLALHGLMLEFAEPAKILEATRSAWNAGYREMDAYTPYPVGGLAQCLGLKRNWIPSIVFFGGLVGAAFGFFMQYYSMGIDYPLNVGGRPYNSWPVFIPITFEVLVLVAAFTAFFAMLFLNGLPRPHHPVFNVPGFELASQERFFLCIEAADPKFDRDETARFLLSLAHIGEVIEVPSDQLGPPVELEGPALEGTVPQPHTEMQVGEQPT